jgi:pyruvate formate lyase activating enzyme
MQIKGFIQNSLLEWEGKVSCVLFLPSCNLRCRYCHAGHLLGDSVLESIQQEQVLRYMRKQNGWLDGVAITGGEPTLHEDELLGLVADIHQAGLEVMVETNGTRPYWVDRLVNDAGVERLAVDVKAPLTTEAYEAITQVPVDVDAIKRSIEIIITSGVDHEFRITVVPGLVGKKELLEIASELRGAKCVAIQNFQPDHCLDTALHSVAPYSPEAMDDMGALMSEHFENVVVRGRDRAPRVRSA